MVLKETKGMQEKKERVKREKKVSLVNFMSKCWFQQEIFHIVHFIINHSKCFK